MFWECFDTGSFYENIETIDLYAFCIGTRYVVVDCGGGTVDITVHELSSTGQLIELHRATGGPHGSTGRYQLFFSSWYDTYWMIHKNKNILQTTSSLLTSENLGYWLYAL